MIFLLRFFNGTNFSEVKPPFSNLMIRIWVKLSLLALEGHKDFDPIVCGLYTCEKFRGAITTPGPYNEIRALFSSMYVLFV